MFTRPQFVFGAVELRALSPHDWFFTRQQLGHPDVDAGVDDRVRGISSSGSVDRPERTIFELNPR